MSDDVNDRFFDPEDYRASAAMRGGKKLTESATPPCSAATATHECCRCKNKHTEADRVMKRISPGSYSIRCPCCNGESYFDLTKS